MVKKLVSKAELSRIAGVSAAAITKAIKNQIGDAMSGKRIDLDHPSVVAYLAGRSDAPVADAPADGIDARYQEAVDHCRSSDRFTASNVARGLKIGYARAEKIFNMMKAAGTDKPSDTAAKISPETKKPAAQSTPGVATQTSTKKAESLNRLNDGDDDLDHPLDYALYEIPENIKMFADWTLGKLIRRFGTDAAFLDWLKATKSIEDINEKRLKNAVTEGQLVSRNAVKIGIIEPIDAAHSKLLTDGAKTIAVRVTAMHGAGRSVDDCRKFIADQMGSFIRPVKAKVAKAFKNA